jgi:hypothetical protein
VADLVGVARREDREPRPMHRAREADNNRTGSTFS